MKKILTSFLLLVACNSQAQTTTLPDNQVLAFHHSIQSQRDVNYFLVPAPPPRKNNCTNGFTVVSTIFAVAGGGLIGWPLGTALGGGDPEWALAAFGAGCIAIAIPLAIVGKKKCDGRYVYNSKGNYLYAAKKPVKQISIASSGNTFGLRLDF